MKILNCGVVLSAALILSACQQGPTSPTSPTPVPSIRASQARDVAGPLVAPDPQAARAAPAARGIPAEPPAATASSAGIGERPYAKPVVTGLARSTEDGRITVEWTMDSDEHVNNYEVQWAPADIAGWSPNGADYPSGSPLTFMPEVGGRSPFGAWKVRVRGRMWRPNLSYCCIGPWSDTMVIEEYKPLRPCYVGSGVGARRLLPGGWPGVRSARGRIWVPQRHGRGSDLLARRFRRRRLRDSQNRGHRQLAGR